MASTCDLGQTCRDTGIMGDVEMVVNSNSSSGNISLTVNLQGHMPEPWSARVQNMFSQQGQDELTVDTIEVTYSLQNASRVKNQVSSVLNDVRSQVGNVRKTARTIADIRGIPTNQVSMSTGDVIPDELRNINKDGLQLAVGGGNQYISGGMVGQTSVATSRAISFPTVKVPVLNEGDLKNRLSGDVSATLVIEARPTETLHNLRTRFSGSYPRVKLNIPASVFIEEVPVADVGCPKLFNNLWSNVERIRDEMRAKREQARKNAEQLDSTAQDLAGAIGSGDINSLRNIGRDRVLQLDQNRLQDIKDRTRNINFEFIDVQSARNRIQNLKDRVRDVGIPDCRSEMMNVLNQAQNYLQQIQSYLQGKEELLQKMRDLMSVSVSRAGQNLPCSQQAPSVWADVMSLEDRARNVTSQNQSRRLVSSIEDAKQRAYQEFAAGGECQQKAINKLEQAESRARNIAGDMPAIPSPRDRQRELPDAPKTCTEKYPEIEDRVDQIEEMSLSLGRSVTQPEIEQLTDEAESVIDEINREVGGDESCASKLASRVNSAVNRVGTIQNTVRVRRQLPEADRQRNQERVEELQSRLDETLGDIEVDLEEQL